MKAEKLAGPYQVDSKRIGDFCWDSQHAWSCRPQVYLGALAKAKPAAAAAAKLGLALLALNSEMKGAAVILLRLLDLPEYQGTAQKMTLQSALKYLTEVHHGEILPCARLFASRSGAKPKDWDAALRHTETPALRLGSVGTENVIATMSAAEGPDNDAQALAAPADDRQVDKLPSDSQRALIRSLEAAAKLGISEVRELGERLTGRLLNCEQLCQHALRAPHDRPRKGKSNSRGFSKGLAWENQVIRRRAEASKPAATATDEARLESARMRTGPELYEHRAEIAALAPRGAPSPGQPVPSWFQAAPCSPASGEHARPQTARRHLSESSCRQDEPQDLHASSSGGARTPCAPSCPRPPPSGKRRPRSSAPSAKHARGRRSEV